MSRRTALWFALVGLLATTVAGPVNAQGTPAVAPEPHLKLNIPALGPIGLALDFAHPQSTGTFDKGQTFSLSVGLFESMLDEAPMPRAMPGCNGSGQFMLSGSYHTDTPAPPLCAFDRCAKPVPACGEVTNLTWTYSGPCVDVVRPAGGFPHPLAGVTTVRWDEAAGGWWVETVRMPLPRPTARPVVLPACCDMEPVKGAGVGATTSGACGAATGALIGAAAGRAEPAACCEKANKLAGTWYRDLEAMVISATFSGDELKLCMTQSGEGVAVCFTLTADCAVTKEGLVHGVITGIDVNVKSDPKAPATESLTNDLLKMSREFQKYVDCPFAFRVKQTSAGVMVSGLKVAAEGMGHDELALVCGMYKFAANGTVPVAKPMKAACAGPECRQVDVKFSSGPLPEPVADAVPPMSPPTPPGEVRATAPPLADPGLAPPPAPGSFGGMTLPSPRRVEHVPQYLPPVMHGGMTLPSPRYLEHHPQYLPPTPSQSLTPPKPANVPAGDFGMMADVFGQMMTTQTGPCQAAPPVVVVPTPQTCPVQPASLSQPAPRMVAALPPAAAMPARSMTGTWVRELGPTVYVIKIAGDHITLSATGATEFEDGKVVTTGMALTADYHLMRDGTTLLGLVTSGDAILDGDLPTGNGLYDMSEAFDRMSKALTDKPLAMSVRLYGDTLVIGNVRLQDCHTVDAALPMSSFGGRYKSIGDRAAPKPKVVKMSDLRKAAPPPGPIYDAPPGVFVPAPFPDGPAYLPPPPLPGPSHAPGYAPPCPVPVQPVSGPAIAAGPYVSQPVPSDRIPPPAPRVNEIPPAPVPMTPPTPPVIDQPKEKKGKKKKKNDAPSTLPPERIHGGILMP